MTDLVLGLDGGGTKTAALALDMDGTPRGTGTAGACNIAALPLGEALAAALAAGEEALAEAGAGWGSVRAVCAGVAGYSHRDRREAFLSGLRTRLPEAIVSVEPDYVVARAGATGGKPGVIVIAGTGSAAYGENGSGESHRAGAYGYLIDDAGSGYGLGRAALAAVLRATDGTGEATLLTERLLAALHFVSVGDIIPAVYGGSLDRLSIAALAPLVSAAAGEDGDVVARSLLMRAGGALARLAEAVAVRLFPIGAEFPVSPVGSLWNAGPPLMDVFVRSLARFAPAAGLTPPLSPPVHGAALRALTAASLR